ncbi:hypothetical protein QYE76_058942 [Lolium multiflorum]|uniref:Gnk2-homologous domain-containing protein n=1 Tax=Lolium multiflorum TaxID=4521 RepID=A0AAD8T6F8_LOLMU|nr:hypothetical protein QYE76_058942 [Lolium multiflorum]
MVGVLLLLLLLMPVPATATAQLCGNGGNYTANSTYQSNLAVLVAALPSNVSSSQQLFATATAGHSPDAVYALALCRDFANAAWCADCVNASFQHAQQTCPYHRSAIVYYEYDSAQQPGCVLGYSGDDAFLSPATSLTENGTLFQSWNEQNISSDARIVAAHVHELLTVTAQDAAADMTRRLSSVVMDSVPMLYSLAQCTPDLSADDCLACLQRLIAMFNATTSVRLGGRIFVLRCNIRFETFMFFDQPMRRISPSSISPAPPTGKTAARAPAPPAAHPARPPPDHPAPGRTRPLAAARPSARAACSDRLPRTPAPPLAASRAPAGRRCPCSLPPPMPPLLAARSSADPSDATPARCPLKR